MKGMTASLRKCSHIIWTKYQSSIVQYFENSLFRIEQL